MFFFHHFEKLDSTNTKAKQFINKGFSQGHVILADVQTNGRGRGSNCWISLQGNLYFSLIVKQEMDFKMISKNTARAIKETLQQCLPNQTITCRNNDIFLEEGKVSGFLIEVYNNHYVVGIGINVASAPIIPNYPTEFLNKYKVIELTDLIELLSFHLKQQLL